MRAVKGAAWMEETVPEVVGWAVRAPEALDVRVLCWGGIESASLGVLTGPTSSGALRTRFGPRGRAGARGGRCPVGTAQHPHSCG